MSGDLGGIVKMSAKSGRCSFDLHNNSAVQICPSTFNVEGSVFFCFLHRMVSCVSRSAITWQSSTAFVGSTFSENCFCV